MAFVQWRDEYDTGIRKIDRQHREIIDVLNSLYDMQAARKKPRQMQRVFGRLRDYIQGHFATEEAYIVEKGCSGAEEQKREHEYFIDTICSYQKDFLKKKSLAEINLFNFVWDWFAHHIMDVDKKCLTGSRNVIN